MTLNLWAVFTHRPRLNLKGFGRPGSDHWECTYLRGFGHGYGLYGTPSVRGHRGGNGA